MAEVLETQGPDAFQGETEKLTKGRSRKDAPKGKYTVLRTTFDKISKSDKGTYEKLIELTEAKNMKIGGYCKWVLSEHVNATY